MDTKALIFDCDGTLVDSLGTAFKSFLFALEQVGEPRTLPEVKKYFGAGADKILTSVIGNQQKGLQAFEIYVKHQTELANEMPLHQGILDLLNKAQDKQIPMGIVTGRHSRDLRAVIGPKNLSHFFKTQITDDVLQKPKPAPEGILLAAKNMGVIPKNSLYVGDSAMDMVAAHQAGAFPVAALWDKLSHKQEMLAEKPYAIAHDPLEVWEIFLKFNSVSR
jgi:HAD superfamily hydrolase (TIGR01549 family)